MNDTQILTIVLATVPNILAVLAGILINNSRLSDLKANMDSRLGDMNTRMGDINTRVGDLRTHMDVRFNHVDQRFDDMRDMWRSELHRVEEILDARLKHLEQR